MDCFLIIIFNPLREIEIYLLKMYLILQTKKLLKHLEINSIHKFADLVQVQHSRFISLRLKRNFIKDKNKDS